MKFNFIVIPLLIFATWYFGKYYIKQTDWDWYKKLKKPEWIPSGRTIGEIWIFLYLLTGFALLWFWNVPKFSWWYWVVAGILLINAGLNIYRNKTFFVEKNLSKTVKFMYLWLMSGIVVTVMIAFASLIASILLLPYLAMIYMVYRAAKLTKKYES